MNPDNRNSFLDRGTILALVLVMFVWFAWSRYMEKFNPPAKTAVATSAAPTPNVAGTVSTEKGEAANLTQPAVAVVEEKTFDFDDDLLSFKLSSRGMGIHVINVKKYKTRGDGPIVLGQVKELYPFSTSLVDSTSPLDFIVERTAPDTFVGRATVGSVQVEKTMKVSSIDYAIHTEVRVTGDLKDFKGVVTTLSETVRKATSSGGFFSAAIPEHQEWYVRHDEKHDRKPVSDHGTIELKAANVSSAAFSEHYFTLGVFDKSEIFPNFEAKAVAGSATTVGRLIYQPVSKPEQLVIKYVSYAGPKAFDLLGRVDESFTEVIDYGVFGSLGKPMLWLLKALHTGVANWGLAIIFLTIIVRLLVLPFNAYSFKSMKAMQKIQPEMNRIREKYKDQPAEAKLQMNQEIMQLMKQNNASPLGGCLPMLLQLPVFWALYQVLGQSVELYRAPFGLWIKDLSDKDPYFVLPVLMGITMYIQQKITPTTMDPQQAKILQWMPVIFSFFMLNLPSGLTLYIFVSTLFGIAQQYYFMRDNSSVGSVKEAKA